MLLALYIILYTCVCVSEVVAIKRRGRDEREKNKYIYNKKYIVFYVSAFLNIGF